MDFYLRPVTHSWISIVRGIELRGHFYGVYRGQMNFLMMLVRSGGLNLAYIKTSTKFMHRCERFKFSIFSNFHFSSNFHFFKIDQTDQK